MLHDVVAGIGDRHSLQTATCIIVVNNGMYSSIRMHQSGRAALPRPTPPTLLTSPDFSAFALLARMAKRSSRRAFFRLRSKGAGRSSPAHANLMAAYKLADPSQQVGKDATTSLRLLCRANQSHAS
jgi:hypothetical protein